MWAQKLYLACEYEQCKAMQDIRKRERERKIQMQTQRYVLRFEPLLYVPTFTQKDFQYVHTGPFSKGPP